MKKLFTCPHLSADIAVIGMSCRFSDAGNYQKFWENLINSVCSVQVIPLDRWDAESFYSSDNAKPNKSVSKWCTVVDDFDRFDHQFFNCPPSESAAMDPQQRILLEETWRCIEDSGTSMSELRSKKTSVYVGAGNEYMLAAKTKADAYWAPGSSLSGVANRISYVFDFQGESLTLDTACASSLYAIHQAKRALMLKECDFAIAAGVQLYLDPLRFIAFSKLGILSPDGCCRAFDKDANGTVIGEGVGVLLLQRLDEAIKENRHIHGIIKGTAVNHTGHALSIAAPSVCQQREVIVSAIRDAGISPETISYIEAHGTGTMIGDPVEVEALTLAFRQFTDKKQFCRIGSVKTNIGHVGAAAGMAGVIKTLLMMRHRQIPPILNFKTPNPVIDFDQSPFIVAENLENWKPEADNIPLRAGVSAYGYTGANSHIILEEFQQTRKRPENIAATPFCFLLSAKTESSLKNLIRDWQKYIYTAEFDSYPPEDICNTLLTGRESFPYRFGCCAADKTEWALSLKQAPDLFEKSDKKRLRLLIGTCYNSGFSQIEPLVLQFGKFRNHMKYTESQLSEVDKTLGRNFRKAAWRQKDYRLFSFLADYSLASALIDSNLSPDIITCDSSGLWTCMALTGMISLKHAIWVLSGYKSADSIELSRPKIPFFDPINRQTIHPFRFDQSYFPLLIRNIKLTDSIYNHYVRTAKRLFQYQPVFRDYMEEWDCWLKIRGTSVATLLQNDLSPKNERILTLLIIVSSLFRLNRKWNLTEPAKTEDQHFDELLALTISQAVSKESVCEVLIGGSLNSDGIVRNLNSGGDEKLYPCLQRHQHLYEISDASDWLYKMMQDAPLVFPVQDDMLTAEFGQCASSDPKSIQIKGNPLKDFWNAMVQLWLKGERIAWETIAADRPFAKKPLPTYPFSGRQFPVKPREQSSSSEPHLSTGQHQPVPNQKEVPLSFAQYRCWRNQMANPNAFFYNIPMWFHLKGHLDLKALRKSFRQIVRRHETLRTDFPVRNGTPVQRIYSDYEVPISVVNLENLPETEQPAEIEKTLAQVNDRPFILNELPLIRIVLIKTGETSHVLGICKHHIITDALSIGIFLTELSHLYNSFVSKSGDCLPPLPLQYSDFSLWQHQYYTPEIMKSRLDYWETWLSDSPSPLIFPFERKNPPETEQYLSEQGQISTEVTEKLQLLSRQSKTTIYMPLLAAVAVLIFRYTGNQKIVIGIPNNGRTQKNLSRIIGLFISTFLIRILIEPTDSFKKTLSHIRQEFSSAMIYQDVPYEQLEQTFQLKPKNRPDAQCRLFVNLSSQPLETTLNLSKLQISMAANFKSRRDLAVNFITETEQPSHKTVIRMMVNYKSVLFDRQVILKLIDDFKILLERAVDDPDISAEEWVSILPA